MELEPVELHRYFAGDPDIPKLQWMFCKEHLSDNVDGCITCGFNNKKFEIESLQKQIDPQYLQLLHFNRYFEKGFLKAEAFSVREMNEILTLENELQRLRNIRIRKMNEPREE